MYSCSGKYKYSMLYKYSVSTIFLPILVVRGEIILYAVLFN